jgi:hypothetical protein
MVTTRDLSSLGALDEGVEVKAIDSKTGEILVTLGDPKNYVKPPPVKPKSMGG